MSEEHREELAAARAEVARAHEELERFASVANHDLRSSIFTARGFLELLDDEDLSPSGQELLDRALEVTDRMRRLVDALTNHVRATSRRLQVQPVELEDAIDGAVGQLRPLIVERDATIEKAQGALPAVQADPDVLVDVLALVIDNAVRYRGAGMAATVQLAADVDGDIVTVTVDDDGPGLPEGTEDAVFEPFERTVTSKGQPGTGLGLSTARRLLERLGGSIRAERRDGGGTRITLQLKAAGGTPGTDGPTR